MKNIKPLFLLFALAVSFQLIGQQGIELKNIKEVNVKELDFSPIPFGNGIIYTTSKSNRFLQCPSENAGDYTDIKYSEKKADGTFGKPEPLEGDINGKYNDGAVAIFPGNSKLIFTRNNKNGRNAEEIIDLKLYTAELVGDKWSNVAELPFNSDDFSTCHPALSADGNLLIFSSNAPGSTENSMDLWWAKLEGGIWTIPKNLGSSVNSAGNELFPYLDENNNLFFSSNRAGGSGGLDIWSAAQNPSTGVWELVGNLGAPFNQAGDEVNFVSMNGGTEGYLASDRTHSDAQGADDIYSWKYNPEIIDAIIAVVDKETNARLSGAYVEMTPVSYGNMLDRIYGGSVVSKSTLTTDNNGEVKVQVRKGTKYSIVTSKTDYKMDKREVSADEIGARQPYIIPLEKDKYFSKLIVEVYEDPSGNRIPLADIKIVDKKTGKVINLTGDGNGEAFTQIDCDGEYEITASKSPYYTNTVTLRDFKLDCKDGEVRVRIPLKGPLIVILEPIFFDFDKYYIRKKDAQPTLDNLVEIMNRYPTLQVRLGGNTDARGTNRYNDRLSTNRANSAKAYLLKKGIAKERVYTDQYGETKLANNCSDDNYCPETDHQLNRRVDVSAERHQEPATDFKTRPVSEMKVESDRKDKKK